MGMPRASTCKFAGAPSGLRIVDQDLTFAEYWTSDDPIDHFRRKFAKCAEVLVPGRIEPESIIGAYVSCEEAENSLGKQEVIMTVTIDQQMFFV